MTAVNHPDHYQHPSGVECVDISRHLPHALAAAFEYVWRWRKKGGVEDLRKAQWWLNDWITHHILFAVPDDECYSNMRKAFDHPDHDLLYLIANGDVANALAMLGRMDLER